MRSFLRFFLVAISCLTATLLMSQTVQDNKQIVQEVVQKYWTMETSGGRLTADGWARANALAARGVARPSSLPIEVVYDDSAVWPPDIKQNTADVITGIRRVGHLGPDLHFTKDASGGDKAGVVFHVILENPAGMNDASKTELPQWKLEQPSKVIWLNLSTAIRYVSDEKSKTTKLAVKQNAERTLTILRKLQASYH